MYRVAKVKLQHKFRLEDEIEMQEMQEVGKVGIKDLPAGASGISAKSDKVDQGADCGTEPEEA
jgi:hypothetical protein